MKKVFIALALILAVGAGLYFYAYKGHREIASESADYTASVKQLQSEFSKDATSANAKYADKTLVVSGTVSAIDKTTATVMIDNVLSASFDGKLPEVSQGQIITVKARFVGYDDLLEEFRTDQASIPE